MNKIAKEMKMGYGLTYVAFGSNNSQSKIKVALGGMTGGAPFNPYA